MNYRQMGEFSRYGSVGIKTNGNVFLSVLPRGRNLFIGNPASHHAGTDRLQMVGVSSLHTTKRAFGERLLRAVGVVSSFILLKAVMGRQAACE